MNVNFAKQNRVGDYGTVNVSFQIAGLNSVTGMVFDRTKGQVSEIVDPSAGSSPGERSLDVLNVRYVVREWVGSWWKGACFRKTRRKVVLNDISLRLRAGEITAVLGNSGTLVKNTSKYKCYIFSFTTK